MSNQIMRSHGAWGQQDMGMVSYSKILNSFICELVSHKWEKEWAQEPKWYPGVCPPIFVILAADGTFTAS